MSVPYQDLGEIIEDQNPYGQGALPGSLEAKIALAVQDAVLAAQSAANGTAVPAPSVTDVVIAGVPDVIDKSHVSGNLLGQELLTPAQEADALWWKFNDDKPFKNGDGYRITKAIRIEYTFHLPASAVQKDPQNFPTGKTITTHLLIGYSGPNGD